MRPMAVDRNIPPITTVPSICREAAPAPLAVQSGQATEDEGQGRHNDRPESDAGSTQSSLGNALPAVVVALGKFNDQDGVLGG